MNTGTKGVIGIGKTVPNGGINKVTPTIQGADNMSVSRENSRTTPTAL